jgi:hypothetical protein
VTDSSEAVENEVNDLPPDGGSGARIPTQSYGVSSAAKASPLLFFASVAALAAIAYA